MFINEHSLHYSGQLFVTSAILNAHLEPEP